MATDFENAVRRKIEKQEPRNDTALEYAEIEGLLHEIDDFVSKLKIFEGTLARQAEDEDDEENMFLHAPAPFDDVTLENCDAQLHATIKRKRTPAV